MNRVMRLGIFGMHLEPASTGWRVDLTFWCQSTDHHPVGKYPSLAEAEEQSVKDAVSYVSPRQWAARSVWVDEDSPEHFALLDT